MTNQRTNEPTKMSDEASQRPWRVTHPGEIEDANGELLYNLRDCIGGGVDEANAALIVDAVNERQRLRDIVQRMADITDSLLANYEYRYRDDANSMAFVRNTREFICEARAAVGEDKQ